MAKNLDSSTGGTSHPSATAGKVAYQFFKRRDKLKNWRSRFWLIQYQVMAVLLFFGAIGAFILVIRNKDSLTSVVLFLIMMVLCLLLGTASLYFAIKRARK